MDAQPGDNRIPLPRRRPRGRRGGRAPSGSVAIAPRQAMQEGHRRVEAQRRAGGAPQSRSRSSRRSRSERSIVSELPIDRTQPASHREAVPPSSSRGGDRPREVITGVADGGALRNSSGRSPSGGRGASPTRSASSRGGGQSAPRSPSREDRSPVVLRPRESPTRRGASQDGGAGHTSPRGPPRGRTPPPHPQGSRGRGQAGRVVNTRYPGQGKQNQRRSPGRGNRARGGGGRGAAPPRSNR